MHNIVTEGRLTTKPILFTPKCGQTFVRFTLANNRYFYQNKELVGEISFFKVYASGQLAQRIHSCLTKGDLILVSGTARQNNVKRYVRIRATNVKLISNRYIRLHKTKITDAARVYP